MGVKGKNAKTEKFDIRLSQQEEAVIKLAAALQCTSPTNFIRQQAVVHEQTRFVVTGKQWQTIEEAMSEPAKVLPNLQKKLLQPDDWDK